MSTDEGALIRRADKQARLERFIADGDHRSLLLRGDTGGGKSTLIQRVSVKAAAKGWRVLLSTAVEAEASVIERDEHPQAHRAIPGRRDRAWPKYGGNSPDRRTPP